MKFALGLAVILGLAMISQAALLTETINGISVDVNSSVPSAGLLSYVFSVRDASKGVYSADGGVYAYGLAKLNQNWPSATAPTPVQDPGGSWGFLTTLQQAQDTNIMVPSVNQVVSRGAAENRPTANGLRGTWLAASSTLTMAFGFQNVPPAGDIDLDPDNYSPGSPFDFASFNLAQVVVASQYNTLSLTNPGVADYVKFSFRLVDGTAPSPLDGQFDIYLAAPEPMTLSLLAAGGLALIRRRR